MSGEAKKLQLIEEIIKIEDDTVLTEVQSTISKYKVERSNRKSFKEFAGMMSENEVIDLENTIEKGCETINPNDWK